MKVDQQTQSFTLTLPKRQLKYRNGKIFNSLFQLCVKHSLYTTVQIRNYVSQVFYLFLTDVTLQHNAYTLSLFNQCVYQKSALGSFYLQYEALNNSLHSETDFLFVVDYLTEAHLSDASRSELLEYIQNFHHFITTGDFHLYYATLY